MIIKISNAGKLWTWYLSAFKAHSVIYSKYPLKFLERKKTEGTEVLFLSSQLQREPAEYDLGISVLLVCKRTQFLCGSNPLKM